MDLSIRQDAWSKKEDEQLALIVLKHIRTGSTQLKAFEEASSKLSRTAAACGFRWNSYVRKINLAKIEDAKQERSKHKKNKLNEREILKVTEKQLGKQFCETSNDENLSFKKVISYLEQMYEQSTVENESKTQTEKQQDEINKLKLEVEMLRTENILLNKKLVAIEDSYKLMSKVINSNGNDASEY